MIRRHVLLICLILPVIVGCARVKVIKDPGPNDEGVRFYRPKPYLFIGPAAEKKEAAASPMKKVAFQEEDGKPKSKEVTIELKYLPDFSEEYSIRMTPGINASTKFDPVFENGWMLTGFASETDQQLDELITAVGGAIKSIGGAAAGAETVTVTADQSVPLGFYEAVILPDDCGKKHLVGWRYVGFFPFTGCPISGCTATDTANCQPNGDVWALVWTGSGMSFKQLNEVKASYSRLPPMDQTLRSDQTLRY